MPRPRPLTELSSREFNTAMRRAWRKLSEMTYEETRRERNATYGTNDPDLKTHNGQLTITCSFTIEAMDEDDAKRLIEDHVMLTSWAPGQMELEEVETYIDYLEPQETETEAAASQSDISERNSEAA
jgi:hypothetical protein